MRRVARIRERAKTLTERVAMALYDEWPGPAEWYKDSWDGGLLPLATKASYRRQAASLIRSLRGQGVALRAHGNPRRIRKA